ncbi:MAG TPA: glycosyltransferase family 2 protein [Vicinamibacteria bacterium]|nr:glycosyltransferase family 2 protein [Vicinamibacteria bacterium]
MLPLSAVIITLDEEQNLPGALASVAFCDEVLVVDWGSSDRTRDIAEATGARVVRGGPWPGFVAGRNTALDIARHDWVLALDADERVTAALREEILAERAAGFRHAGYRVPRVAWYLGRWIRGTDWYPDPQLRLFDRRRGRWHGSLIHESVRVAGSVGRLRSEMQHLSYADVSHHMRVIDSYTTLWARQAFDQGRRARPFEPFAACAWAFLRNLVFRRGFLLGETGLTVSMLNAYYTYAKLVKLHELAIGRPRP